MLTKQDVLGLVNAARVHGIYATLTMSLMLREGVRRNALPQVTAADYRPASGGEPGSLTYRDGDLSMTVKLSSETESILSDYLAQQS